jgi:AcrR family transcriptional regulator
MLGVMNPPRAVPKARASRGRRGSRPSGDDRELAILSTAERLLAERSFAEISIDDLAKGAGISRPTFYFYFPSKVAVLLSLLDRVAGAASSSTEVITPAQLARDPARHWRAAIAAFFHTFSAHRPVAIACAEASTTDPEVRALWSSIMSRSIMRTTLAIQAERERGAAPDGLPAHDLAIALNQMNERAMYAAFTDQQPAIARDDAVDVLLGVWLRSIYLTADPPADSP